PALDLRLAHAGMGLVLARNAPIARGGCCQRLARFQKWATAFALLVKRPGPSPNMLVLGHNYTASDECLPDNDWFGQLGVAQLRARLVRDSGHVRILVSLLQTHLP